MDGKQNNVLPLDAQALGLQGTISELQRLLVEKYRVAKSPDSIRTDQPIFSAGVGLSSLEGMELLAELERRFRVEFKNIDDWIDESPTLASVAEYLVEHSRG